jgi:hypothetical protein
MKYVKKADELLSGWLKDLPRLPANVQNWIAENVWWIVLVGAIMSGIAVLMGIAGLFTALALVGTGVTYYGYAFAGAYTGGWIVSAIVSLVFMAGLIGLLATAVTPLRAMKARGWDLLFMALLLQALYAILNAFLTYNIVGFVFSLIFSAIGLAIGAYFLFEIKSHFVKSSKK